MKLFTSLLALAGLATAALNTTREYQLKTCLKSGQSGKSRYDNLWLSSYHTGAGLNDVVFDETRAAASKGFLNATNVTSGDRTYYNQLFDLGTTFAWGLVIVESESFYAAWQPVEMNAGVQGSDTVVSGFFINSTGLQWTSDPKSPGSSSDAFGGWLVCDWWHGVPQLFFRFKYYPTSAYPAPASCADIDLLPQYI
ncbi:uncharacterized protein MYCFIDRAFT_89396 [Pseudocercospora fijiensis CIRAD86]|uniref:DUF7907 domain-containing protein n=1 Tax=Pseudocercospora fijiensis (strain CIRAD86) TaxID=383855 RepID=M3A2V6_PSEFD|nr:uncharacterized protein MYCFIDRAFT_89396 [Pseudocercospora fijiensis CIRAD86]EME78756.1 hypothetical protein MYCFIDRAFT_89396 [Pseudocercospora fijiensis CIRAD86]